MFFGPRRREKKMKAMNKTFVRILCLELVSIKDESYDGEIGIGIAQANGIGTEAEAELEQKGNLPFLLFRFH